jgi:hypothetical protein
MAIIPISLTREAVFPDISGGPGHRRTDLLTVQTMFALYDCLIRSDIESRIIERELGY